MALSSKNKQVTAEYEQEVFFTNGKYRQYRFTDKDDESVALAPGYLFASIFPPGGHTAPDVAFLFVSLQYRPDLGVEGRVVLWKTAHQVLVNGGFGNAKVTCGCPYSSAGFDHVHSKSAGSFFYGLLHGFPSDAV